MSSTTAIPKPVVSPPTGGADVRVLVTGAAGYIGSHTCVELIAAGHEVIGVDNFDNSYPEIVDRINNVTGIDVAMHTTDVTNAPAVAALVAEVSPDVVVHFAGRKAVGESVADPLLYERVNMGSAVAVANAMRSAGVDKIVFSSSCTVYGNPTSVPVDESHPLQPINPYGRTKHDIEQLLRECACAYDWAVLCLRYFNPIGAHGSGLLGEAAKGEPVNLMPRLLDAVSYGTPLPIFGDDYSTYDGTCVRDYVHVVDLARGHVAAVEALDTAPAWDAINLGTGRGSSVLDIVQAARAVTGESVPYEVSDRRPGDAAEVFADVSKAARVLGWHAELDLADMVADAWRWRRTGAEQSFVDSARASTSNGSNGLHR